jgi:hypothetical protein
MEGQYIVYILALVYMLITDLCLDSVSGLYCYDKKVNQYILVDLLYLHPPVHNWFKNVIQVELI